VRERTGNTNAAIVPASDFETADGRLVSIHAGTDSLFRRFATAIGRPELADDPCFRVRAARIENQERLYELIARWAAARQADEIVATLSAADVPASPIMSVADLMADPHCRERASIVSAVDPQFGAVPMVAPLPSLSATPGAIRWTGPALGEHTDEVLAELLDLTGPEIAKLRAQGVV
jgi:crotonobetainyl-CoA:carnitine CoA-transferase CaiB-like acyl-CoA transferase